MWFSTAGIKQKLGYGLIDPVPFFTVTPCEILRNQWGFKQFGAFHNLFGHIYVFLGYKILGVGHKNAIQRGYDSSTPAGVVVAAVEYSVVQVCVHRFEFLNKTLMRRQQNPFLLAYLDLKVKVGQTV